MRTIVKWLLILALGSLVGCRKAAGPSARHKTPDLPWSTAPSSLQIPGLLPLDHGQPDEVWIIERNRTARDSRWDRAPRADLMARDRSSGRYVPLPLERTVVNAKVSLFVAEVVVEQQFSNPYGSPIEATYQFPLPEDASVTDFLMKVGSRTIRGLIRERDEAERVYQQAKRQGYTASIMTEERPNIFSQKVANIKPGHRIDIEVTYFNTLGYDEGEYEFVLPMIIGPRYTPPGHSGGVGAAARGRGARSPEDVVVEYLAPNERSGHRIDLNIDLDAGLPI
ncbi:MAG: VIT domain-containing protein, partial [Verrucomicrobiota bacterium]